MIAEINSLSLSLQHSELVKLITSDITSLNSSVNLIKCLKKFQSDNISIKQNSFEILSGEKKKSWLC